MLASLAFPVIDPVAVSFGPIVIRWYALAYISGILLGWRYVLKLAALPPERFGRQVFDDYIVWATTGIILGGRLGYVLFYNPAYFAANPEQILMVWRGGMAFHGGLLGVIVSTWAFTRKHDLSLMALGDLICAAAPIGLFFGRIANFINGELFGRASDVPWAMVFPNGGEFPRHPSQLYEAILEGLVLFLVLLFLYLKPEIRNRPGTVAGAFFIGYGIARSIVEFFREPDAHLGFLFAFVTMGQLLSLPMILLGIWLIMRARKSDA